MEFIVGQEYRRVDLHKAYGGSRQGGISPSRVAPIVMLITSPAGERHGYQYDGFQPDGTYFYTGEGQVGDMAFVRGNRAIRDAEGEGRELHLFEESRRGHLRYVGRAHCLGHHYAPAPDRLGRLRQALIFELALESGAGGSPPATNTPEPRLPRGLWTRPLAELRQIATETPPPGSSAEARRVNTYRRSEAVKVYVLRRASGICEACGLAAPFLTQPGRPYLEPHHLTRLADGGPDHPEFVAAICPNCHKRVHHGADGAEYNAALALRIAALEPGRR